MWLALGFVLALLGLPYASPVSAATVGNPVLAGYQADPSVEVFDGKYYIYPTSPDNRRFHVWSSTDFSNWTDEGVLLDIGPQVSWDQDTYPWAPDMVARNGKYYFYFSANLQIGVAVCDSPAGPCTDKGAPLVGGWIGGVESIDPMVFIDDDGQAYLYYGGSAGNGKMGVYKLNPDMTSLDGGQIIHYPINFTEGAFLHKRHGTYYLSYSNGRWYDSSYNVQYSTSNSPLGPWTYRGQILSSNSEDTGPGHHSFLQYSGTDDWYVVYHRHENSGGDNRRVAIDRMYFDGGGSIQPIMMTNTGVERRTAPRQVTLQSYNNSDGYLRHRYTLLDLTSIRNWLDQLDSTFVVVPGLSGSGVSLKATNLSDYYVRHQGGRFKVSPSDGTELFRQDATFQLRPGLADRSLLSFESHNYAAHYLRHRYAEFWLDAFTDTQLFRSDATFRSSHQSFESYNAPGYYLRHRYSVADLTPVQSGQDYQDASFVVVPGLAGGGVSFKSVNIPGHYLRHSSWRVRLDRFEDTSLFRSDATFHPRPGLADGSLVSFESHNYPNHYLRHRYAQFWLDAFTETPLFRSDATFRPTLLPAR
jgi:hypothetical protein